MVEAAQFHSLSNRHSVMGVPRTVINETTFIKGTASEAMLMAQLAADK